MHKLKSFKTLFHEAWHIYTNRFGVLIAISAIPSLIFFASGLFAGINIVLLILGVIVGFIFSIASGLALMHALKHKETVGASYKKAFASLWSYGWILFLMMLITFGGIFMGVIPAIIFSIFFVFATYIFVFEGDKGLGALLKSREYVRNYWWAVWWKMFIMGLVTILPLLLILAVVSGVGFAQNMSEDSIKGIVDISQQLLGIFITPFVVAYVFSLYHNLVTLKPEIHGKKVEGKKGFWIFAAVWGVVAPLILAILSAAMFSNQYY